MGASFLSFTYCGSAPCSAHDAFVISALNRCFMFFILFLFYFIYLVLKTQESCLQSFILSKKLLFNVAGGCAEARQKNDAKPGNSLKTLQPYDIIFAKFLDQPFPWNLKDRLLALQHVL